MPRRQIAIMLLLTALLAGAVILRLVSGSDGLGWPGSDEVLGLRARRVVLAGLCGAALSLAGVMLQSFLRNPLASPDLTGVGAGAGLGVIAAVYVLYLSGQAATPAMFGPAALAGALLTLAIVSLAARSGTRTWGSGGIGGSGAGGGGAESVSMVLIGVAVGIVASAMGLLIQHLMPPDPARPALRWLIGALDENASVWVIGSVAVAVAAGLIGGVLAAPAMDAMSLSTEEAQSVGVGVRAARIWLFLAGGVLTAGAVVLGGPIGFVGLICPHVVRSLAGPGHRVLIIGSALAGASLLIGADVIVRLLPTTHGVLPIGVVTAMIGGPALIVMLRRGVHASPA